MVSSLLEQAGDTPVGSIAIMTSRQVSVKVARNDTGAVLAPSTTVHDGFGAVWVPLDRSRDPRELDASSPDAEPYALEVTAVSCDGVALVNVVGFIVNFAESEPGPRSVRA